MALLEPDPEQHHRDGGDGVRLEEVGRHPCAVADVVTDVVRDHRGVAGIVLGDARLDLADEVGTDVRGLRVDASAQTGEHGDQRAAEREPDQVVDRGLRAVPDPVGQHPVVPGHAEEAEPDHEEPGHRARAERDLERGLQAFAGSLGRADVRAHGDVHADEPGGPGEDRADQEAERGPPAELRVEAEQEERHDRDDRNRRVLLPQIRRSALLDRARDLLHELVPRRLSQQPPGQVDAVQHREHRARKRESDSVIYEEVHRSSGSLPITN